MSTHAIICPACEVEVDANASYCPNCERELNEPFRSPHPGFGSVPMEQRCCLTAKDHSLLEALLDRLSDGDDPIRGAVLAKLSSARVVLTDDIDPNVVTLNSRVAFCVDDGGPELRILILGEISNVLEPTLPVTTMRGLALLGMAEGDDVLAARQDGSEERIRVISVPHQPEDARRRGLWPIASSSRSDKTGPAFGVIEGEASSGPDKVAPLRARPAEGRYAPAPQLDDDDPGPAAA